MGEYLALTGQVIGPSEAIGLGLADLMVPSGRLPALLEALCDQPHTSAAAVEATIRVHSVSPDIQPQGLLADRTLVDTHFGQPTLAMVMASLAVDGSAFASAALAALRRRSPQMLDVSLTQIRRARSMSLAAELRMERDLVRHCFATRLGAAAETVEGIRALVIDKDHAPKWSPARIEDLDDAVTAAYFVSPWPVHIHPLRMLEQDDGGTR
jgi:enoyl-CoA hydratase